MLLKKIPEISKLIVSRKQLVDRIYSALEKLHCVAIIGLQGTGKTTLTNEVLQVISHKFKGNIYYYYGYALGIDRQIFSQFTQALSGQNNLIVIDEYESIQPLRTIQLIYSRIGSLEINNSKVIICSRVALNKYFFKNIYTIDLNCEKFDKEEMTRLIAQHEAKLTFKKYSFASLSAFIEEFNGNFGQINSALTFVKHTNHPLHKIINLVKFGRLEYNNELIESIPKDQEMSTLILPKFVTDTIFINDSILLKIQKNPNAIYNLSSWQFEELVAELFHKEGYNVIPTKRTHDGGKDMMVVENKLLGNFLCYVECKKYGPDKPVGVRVVRELYGTIKADNATAGIIVSSSYFSKQACSFRETIKHQMNLIDFAKLSEIISKAAP